jgi:hypothetical protein
MLQRAAGQLDAVTAIIENWIGDRGVLDAIEASQGDTCHLRRVVCLHLHGPL